jgi:protein-S-isoprenylcysteine O-methyltransferase Ste14
MVKRIIQLFVFFLAMAACLFVSAGRWDWPNAWLTIGLYMLGVVTTWFAVMRKNPELAAVRAEAGKDAKGWDKVLAPLMGAAGPMAIWITSGLSERYNWLHPPSPAAQIAGAILFAAGFWLVIWAMASNNYISSVVRIQRERGHTVAAGGPYQYVRHPGYTGMTGFTLAMPLLLGSYAAFIPAIATVAVTILRTALEDRTLRRELDGYSDYAGRVRYRLAPGLW